jgi:hypothetical protein
MAYFAKIENEIVTNVIIIDNSVESEGQSYINNTLGVEGEWIQTSYNDNFRGNYAGIGYTYDRGNDVFIAPQLFPSWVLNNKWQWESPIPHPNNTEPGWIWDEDTLSWINIYN